MTDDATVNLSQEQIAAAMEVNRRALTDKCRYYTPNGRAEEFINLSRK